MLLKDRVVRRRSVGALFLAAAVAVPVFAAAQAGAQVKANSLFHGGGGSAIWTVVSGAPSAAGNQALQLTLPGSGGFAGLDLIGESSAPPSTPPSFAYNSSVTGAAQGSPRLVIAFSDGDNISLQPTTTTAGTWSVADGSTASWNDAGHGQCAEMLGVTYQQALACHSGATVTDAYVVADASFPGGAVIDVAAISYGGTTIRPQIGNVNKQLVAPSLTVVCPSTSGGRCHVSAKLTAASGGHSVAVGTLTGNVTPRGGAVLTFNLNARGGDLLANTGRFRVTIKGWVSGRGRRDRLDTTTILTTI